MQAPAELGIAQLLPPAGCPVADAQQYTRWLATHHYENFHVASWLLPRRLHQHFYNVYAYCRWADDLGDEVAGASRALELLDWWDNELELCYAGQPSHPVFVALAPTIQFFDIPVAPFRDLLTAFRQDQTVHRYDSWQDLLAYCRYSANPVGRLVLYLGGYRDAGRQDLSDATCTALQLANFWQDVSRDLEKGRIYIPLDIAACHGLTAEEIEARCFDTRYVELMKDLIARTRVLFAQGAPLTRYVDSTLRIDLDLFSRGGLAVLDVIETIGYDTLHQRPSIGDMTRASLLGKAVAGRVGTIFEPILRKRTADRVPGEPPQAAEAAHDIVAASYAECRRVAREAASNFYYAFYMLPRAKRDALCALYAFMRLVDDVSDNEPGAGPEQSSGANLKRVGLAHWRTLLDQAVEGKTEAHAILPAFAHTLRNYRIPPRYLHDLISGAEMDLTELQYGTFERLREYCYRVAGTVGLTCLHVFGFEDPHAPELAERLGIAFQLTNILRDVSSDSALGRIYLPAEDLERFGCSIEELRAGRLSPAVRALMQHEAGRAWSYYDEGVRLLPLVHTDSRAALWALVRIYSALLTRIEERGFDVFSSRVRLNAGEKAGILARARLGWFSEGDVLEKRNHRRRGSGGAVVGSRTG